MYLINHISNLMKKRKTDLVQWIKMISTVFLYSCIFLFSVEDEG